MAGPDPGSGHTPPTLEATLSRAMNTVGVIRSGYERCYQAMLSYRTGNVASCGELSRLTR